MKPDSQIVLGKYFRQCVGIDVSKEKFVACLEMYDIASDVGCNTACIEFKNTKTGFNQLVKWSRKECLKDYPLTFLMEFTSLSILTFLIISIARIVNPYKRFRSIPY